MTGERALKSLAGGGKGMQSGGPAPCFSLFFAMIRHFFLLPAFLLSACSAPGFAGRKPGDPAKIEVTLERSFTKSH